MPPSKASASSDFVLICGQDDHATRQRSKQVYEQWISDCPDHEQEIVDGSAATVSEASQALSRCLEALQTLSFFGAGKLIWFRHCTFLGEEKMAASKAVTEGLAAVVQEVQQVGEGSFRLLISAGKVDKRKSFYKQFQKLGKVEVHDGWDPSKSDWVIEAEQRVRDTFAQAQIQADAEAISLLVELVGPHPRQLEQESEKVVLFASASGLASSEDVRQVVSRNKQAKAFALGDALGNRDLETAMRCLDEELWEMRLDRQRSAIGLLYGLISKVRTLILVKEMQARGWLRSERQFFRFKQQLEQIPAGEMPEDPRFNPMRINPYVLFRALPQSDSYQMEELVSAMHQLFRANQLLVSSPMSDDQILQQTLVSIMARPTPKKTSKTS
ncbi:MAG: hypothetical protein VW579_09850 [Verrucomicrobiales bacterium]